MTVFGDGTQTRAFSYIDDVAPIMAEAIDSAGCRNQVFNVGADQPCSLNELADGRRRRWALRRVLSIFRRGTRCSTRTRRTKKSTRVRRAPARRSTKGSAAWRPGSALGRARERAVRRHRDHTKPAGRRGMPDDGYHAVHLTPDRHAPPSGGWWPRIWRRGFRRSSVLEIGAGYCDWINNVRGARASPSTSGPQFASHAAPGVRATRARRGGGPAVRSSDGAFDVVLASNVLEHFVPMWRHRSWRTSRGVLRPGGRFIVIQPNFRSASRRYFDDYTHRSIFTDVSLPALLRSKGFASNRSGRGSCPTRCAAPDCRSRSGWSEHICCRRSSRWRDRCSSSQPRPDRHVRLEDRHGRLSGVQRGARTSGRAVEDFFLPGVVDEVLVVDNNSRDRHRRGGRADAARVSSTRRRRVTAMRFAAGCARPSGDIVILAEPDGTFVGRDILKLLAYADDFDMVCGTRTTRELIWQQANMGWFLRVGNWVVAKMIQVLYDAPSLTDCGCTLRLTHRAAVDAHHRRPDGRRIALSARDGDPRR